MRHFDAFVRWTAALLLTVLSIACGKDKTTTTEGSAITGGSWSQTETIEAVGAQKDFSFTARGQWSAQSDNPDWCEVLTPSGDKGAATLRIDVAENSSESPRSAIIRISVGSTTESFKILQKGTAGAPEINVLVDEVLAAYYLWNEEYRALDRDLSLPYNGVYDNFVYHTLMSMETNTLDKKYNERYGEYHIYSYLSRTPSSGQKSAATRSGVNHGVEKDDPVPSFGIGNYALVSFVDQSGRPTGQIGLTLLSIIPESPLAKAGFRRGDIIATIDGKTPTEQTYTTEFTRLIAPSEGLKVTLTKNEANAQPIEVTSVSLDPTPIIRAEVLEGTHVGYIVYDSFDAAYDNDLLAAIKSLKEAGITDLVLDLRNNGGGHVITSNMLSTCIGGSACQDRVYQYYRYNDERMADWKQTSETFGMSYDQTAKLFFEKFYYSNYYGVSLANYALNLSRLYVLVSDGTASASEAVINSLKGIGLPVTLIGSKTNGKNVGMNVFTWNNIEGYDYEFAQISFKGYNAQKQSVDPKGITPDYAVSETASGGWYVDFGPDEPLVHKALELIGAADASATTRSVKSVGAVQRGSIRQAIERPNGMIRTIDPKEM